MPVWALKWIGGGVLVLFVALALFFTFGLNTLKGPITKAVTKATGRELVIEGDLRAVWSWLHPRVRAEGVTFANADWGKADYLLDAKAIEASISVLPLFVGRVVLPEVHLEGAELSLEQDAEGRKNWVMSEEPDEQKDESRFFVKLLTVNEGQAELGRRLARAQLQRRALDRRARPDLPGEGTYAGMPLKAKGHTGHVLSVRDEATPFPIEAEIKIGDTSAKLEGTLTGLVGFKGIDLQFEQLSGKSMEDLYWIIGLAFPDTSPYKLSGRLLSHRRHVALREIRRQGRRERPRRHAAGRHRQGQARRTCTASSPPRCSTWPTSGRWSAPSSRARAACCPTCRSTSSAGRAWMPT